MKRILGTDWEAVAAATAAVVAIVLDLLHVVDEGVLLTVVMVILAIMVVRDLRRESREEQAVQQAARTEEALLKLQSYISPPDTILIGPRRLRLETERFAQRSQGEMVWFNVCLLMFAPRPLFDAMLRPAIENPRVTSIQFVLDAAEKERWQELVLPKVATCTGKEKVQEPRWCDLKESVSFIIAETQPDGAAEALLSFWGEPFMSRERGRDIPRYIFHVQSHSELVARLYEIDRLYRLHA